MNGSIKFNNAASLAQFLKDMVGSTATFKTIEHEDGSFTLTFDGGF